MESLGGILVVKLGAMGDILHALPAAASLKHSFPALSLTWLVESCWAPLLDANPFVDRVITLERKRPLTWRTTRRQLLERSYAVAVDFQGLLKSAFAGSLARPDRIVGFHRSQVRERAASLFYSQSVVSESVHAADRNLDLARAAGATSLIRSFPIGPGQPEGRLPADGFVLASPLAGWASKQWPLPCYTELAQLLRRDLGLTLVLNGPPSAEALLRQIPGTWTHISGIPGLIDATRRATAVIGVDSGPMHLAAALGKPGAALFGPTDPARNGPYGGTLQVLRSKDAVSRYQRSQTASGAYLRSNEIDPAMRAIAPADVLAALRSHVPCHT